MGMVIGFIIGFFGALWGAIALYTNYVVPLVPAGEYHGLIQLVVAVTAFMTLGGAVIAVALGFGVLLAFLSASMWGGKP